ncbi:hypothetical protein C8P63_11549 [Melghirimyces profundicolus]|uniref:Uncharacterized protein n=1 Tax=Melghirimyces profundicolus TaxID=1242148 RepID=A0A2T6BRD3_9BACL|nr:hypothetical protein C8P63_11549 [Melghirimyces profundicolus]
MYPKPLRLYSQSTSPAWVASLPGLAMHSQSTSLAWVASLPGLAMLSCREVALSAPNRPGQGQNAFGCNTVKLLPLKPLPAVSAIAIQTLPFFCA